jgi:hypothetical protein
LYFTQIYRDKFHGSWMISVIKLRDSDIWACGLKIYSLVLKRLAELVSIDVLGKHLLRVYRIAQLV